MMRSLIVYVFVVVSLNQVIFVNCGINSQLEKIKKEGYGRRPKEIEEAGEASRAYKSTGTPRTIPISFPKLPPRRPLPSNGARKERWRAHQVFFRGGGEWSRFAWPCISGRGGRGGRGSASSTSRNTAHTGVTAFDFIVDLHCRPYSRLYLPDSFAMAMANRRPEGF